MRSDDQSAAAIRARGASWAGRVYGPILMPYRLSAIAAVLGAIVAAVVGVVVRDWTIAALAGLGLSAAGFAAAWWPIREPW